MKIMEKGHQGNMLPWNQDILGVRAIVVKSFATDT